VSLIGSRVTDINGVRYVLVRELGRGGQGAVYEVDGGRLAAKILRQTSSTSRERLRNQLTNVKRLDLQDLAIARPREMLREPTLGYVMELLTGMQPLKALVHVPSGTTSPEQWYAAGGGLRRRLALLARSANALAALHAKGLVYADPSPNNIFVSEDPNATEVRFIDSDNIHYQSAVGVADLYTPPYGAPELVTNTSGINTLTDAHAFSAIAFQTLTLAHPLIGNVVNEGPPELEDEALAGRLPWIDDPHDPTNSSTYGIERAWVLSKNFKELASRAFGAGLKHPRARPRIAEWEECLRAAAAATIACPSCEATYYLTEEACPWCQELRPEYVLVKFHIWDPAVGSAGGLLKTAAKKSRLAAFLVLSPGETIMVDRHFATGHLNTTSPQPVIEMKMTGRDVAFRALDGETYYLTSASGSRQRVSADRTTTIRLKPNSASPELHLGSERTLHRVASCELRPAGSR
jgi:eukaryotic-like serine/threonine-protein kinase